MFLSIAVDVVAFFTTPLPPAFHFLVKSFGCFTLSAFFSSLVLSTFSFSARDFFLSFLPFLIYYGVARQKAIIIQFMCWFGLQLITIRGFENIFYCSVPLCVWCGGFIRLHRHEHLSDDPSPYTISSCITGTLGSVASALISALAGVVAVPAVSACSGDTSIDNCEWSIGAITSDHGFTNWFTY